MRDSPHAEPMRAFVTGAFRNPREPTSIPCGKTGRVRRLADHFVIRREMEADDVIFHML